MGLYNGGVIIFVIMHRRGDKISPADH